MQVIGKALGFDAVADAQRAEAAGYDGVRAVDHFFSGIPPAIPSAIPHCFVTMAAAAACTRRVLLTQTMVAATLRHPFEVAQAVACLDRVSSGRAELGLGTGWLPSEHASMGLDLGTPGERIARVVEAARICREMFANNGIVSFDGQMFRAHSDAPWPDTPHVPEIMMGAHGPTLLRGAAEVADRIDMLEALSGGQPNFSDQHANNAENLHERMTLASNVADGHGKALRFSATVNLLVSSDTAHRDDSRRGLAAAAHCDVAAFDGELLRIIDVSEGALARLQALAALGIDRLHIRPMDPATHVWLDEALPSIRAMA
jgi:alkanesulfonate monooxygenase SsuD/methylene tetrahydromethanopterin reductase-like flavin-dependent oxidoreductase (luciferase family)